MKYGKENKFSLTIIIIVSLLWFITIPIGIKSKKIDLGGNDQIFREYRTAGFNTLIVQNGKWIAGFSSVNMDLGGSLILVIPGFEAAPEDLQQSIATPCETVQEAIHNSFKRYTEWAQRQKINPLSKKTNEMMN